MLSSEIRGRQFRREIFSSAPLTSQLAQAMPIRHTNAAGDRANDADEALVGAADEEVLQMRHAVNLFVRRAVDGAVVVAGEANDRRRRKHIGVDNMPTVIGDESHRRGRDSVVPPQLFESVGIFLQRPPAIEVRQGRDPHRAVVERLVVGEIIGRADHAARTSQSSSAAPRQTSHDR